MMEITPARSRKIGSVEKKDDSVYLTSERGIMRICPMTDRSVRISYTETGFEKEQGVLLNKPENAGWSFEEDEKEIRFELSEGVLLRVDRNSGSIKAYLNSSEFAENIHEKTTGKKPVFSTDDRLPFALEAFDSYRTKKDSEIRTEQIVTPDGVKSRIIGRETEFDETLYHTTVNLKFSENEHIIGLGQSEDGLYDFRGTTQYLHQANRKIAIPFFISSAGYGFLSTTESPAVFSDTAAGSFFRTEADEYLDFVLILSKKPKMIIHEYRRLTGKAAMLPRWAFGYVQSMERYETQEELLRTAAEFEKRKLPLDLIVLDWLSWDDGMWGQKSFDASRFPKPDEMVRKLHDGGVHFMMSIWPNMTSACDNYKEMKANGCILPGTEIYDAFSERGLELYNKQLQQLAKYGVDSWWCDSSEPCTPEWGKRSRPAPASMYYDYVDETSKCMPIKKSNAYGYYHAAGMYRGSRKDRPDKRVVNLTRNGYIGSQAHGTILWSGDTSASWQTFRNQIAAGLNFVASGHPYWTLDIGAFFVKYAEPWFWDGDYPAGLQDPGFRELYVRWFQFGAFLPIFRAHGTDVRREPWAFENFNDLCYDALKKALLLRYRLMPYIYSAAGNCCLKDGMIMAPLAMEFPEDDRVWTVKDQFMFGTSIMICPITSAGEEDCEEGQFKPVTRRIYFPKGADWYAFDTMEKYNGGSVAEITAAIDEIPLFVREGAMIPTQQPMLHTEDQVGQDIELLVFPGADGSCELYEDAGDGYGYENGEYSLTLITHDFSKHEITIKTTGDTRFRRGVIHPVFLSENKGE